MPQATSAIYERRAAAARSCGASQRKQINGLPDPEQIYEARRLSAFKSASNDSLSEALTSIAINGSAKAQYAKSEE